jgi:hypothetical protein
MSSSPILDFLLDSTGCTTTPTTSSCSRASPASPATETRSVWTRSTSRSVTEVPSMTGENPVVSWHTQPSVLPITSHQRSLVAMDTRMIVIGGVWERSCSSVKSAGLHSALKTLTTLTARLSIGARPCTSQMTFLSAQRLKISSEGMSSGYSVEPHANT